VNTINFDLWVQQENLVQPRPLDLIERIDNNNPLRFIYSKFNGEKNLGAWRPGYRFSSLSHIFELIDETSDAWEWQEEETAKSHFMRSFFPFISCTSKTSIGIICSLESCYYDHIIEYSYESGEFRIWSISSEEFFTAFFCREFLGKYSSSSEHSFMELNTVHDFTTEEKEILSRWVGIRFPVLESLFLNIRDVTY